MAGLAHFCAMLRAGFELVPELGGVAAIDEERRDACSPPGEASVAVMVYCRAAGLKLESVSTRLSNSRSFQGFLKMP